MKKNTIPLNEDGYQLWLRYRKVDNRIILSQYRRIIGVVTIPETGVVYHVIRRELKLALPAMLDKKVPVRRKKTAGRVVVIGSVQSLGKYGVEIPRKDRLKMGEEGYLIRRIKVSHLNWIIVTANTQAGLLYGSFHFLRLLQTYQDIREINVLSCPRIHRRLLAHWDNLDGTVERGYAGQSLWKWDWLPQRTGQRVRDYARACASIGINGVVLNNVNCRAAILDHEYLVKIAALADVFRPYGIRTYLSITFNAPELLGILSTSDPRDPSVARWWQQKAMEIYRLIPDFGGFQVKASSEGQSGPQDYGADHYVGANMLADVLRPYQGIVLWRAFVYDSSIDPDRAKCAYKEFVPMDGKFAAGVFVQVKNGPVDFQPREPFHPLFGAMPGTPLAMEFQVTQEYLGQAVHLVYLAPQWQEILAADTYARGQGSTVASIVDGSLFRNPDSVIIGVANTGSARNWCGHHFAQANWYAYGRIAWDHRLSVEEMCDEWVKITWSRDAFTAETIKKMMLGSWEACINYMTPLGLHHIMQEGHHYGPDPAFNTAQRADWNSVYYHRADKNGLGFDRSPTGSNATGQYFSPQREELASIVTCPEKYLLWFHHVPWRYRLQSGRTLIEEIEYCYENGAKYITRMREDWELVRGKIDQQRHEHVAKRLQMQEANAREWRDVCLRYFRQFVR